MLEKPLGLFLLTTPFLIAWGLFILLAPVTFWQILATIVISLVICIPEGLLAWFIGLILLTDW